MTIELCRHFQIICAFVGTQDCLCAWLPVQTCWVGRSLEHICDRLWLSL